MGKKKEEINISGMFIYEKGSSQIKSSVSRYLKNHLSMKTITDVMSYDQGREYVNKFTFIDVSFVESFVSFSDKNNGLTFVIFVNGKQLNMALLK